MWAEWDCQGNGNNVWMSVSRSGTATRTTSWTVMGPATVCHGKRTITPDGDKSHLEYYNGLEGYAPLGSDSTI